MYGDIYDAWQSITSVVNYIGDDGFNFTEVSGPGHFSDADMVGNFTHLTLSVLNCKTVSC